MEQTTLEIIPVVNGFTSLHTAGENSAQSQQLRPPSTGIKGTRLWYRVLREVAVVTPGSSEPVSVMCYFQSVREVRRGGVPHWQLSGFCKGDFGDILPPYDFYPCVVEVTTAGVKPEEAEACLQVTFNADPVKHEAELPHSGELCRK